MARDLEGVSNFRTVEELQTNLDPKTFWFVTGLATQWKDGKIMGVWPNKWKMTPESPEVTYKGMVPIKIPPWMAENYKK